MTLRANLEAEAEFVEAVQWYAQQSCASADRLTALVEQAFAAIESDPRQFPLHELRGNPGDIRRVHLKPFPYLVVYQVTASGPYVLAVTHTSRRPGYWRSRRLKN